MVILKHTITKDIARYPNTNYKLNNLAKPSTVFSKTPNSMKYSPHYLNQIVLVIFQGVFYKLLGSKDPTHPPPPLLDRNF